MVSKWANQVEEVFEVDHLEHLPPYTKSGLRRFNFGDDGITTVTCLNTKEQFQLHNDPKFWNSELNQEFMQRVSKKYALLCGSHF